MLYYCTMITSAKIRFYPLAILFTFFLFVVFAMLWIYIFNRYSALYYQEQIQLFQFDIQYFCSYLKKPGGLCGYSGSFLTQFYAYPFAGAIVITTVLLAVLLVFYDLCRFFGNIGRLFFIPFIPPVLLLISFVNIHFDMSFALGLLFVITAFRWYIALQTPIRYFAGFFLFIAVYFIAGGNALLLAVLFFIFEITNSRDPFKIPYLLILPAFSAILPYLAWRSIYIVPIRSAYFALTPVEFLFPTKVNMALWISFPLLFIIWRLVAAKTNQWIFSLWKFLIPNFLIVSILIASAFTFYDRKAEILNHITCSLAHDHLDSVLALSKEYPTDNRLICYLSNIALAESGQMPYRMFQYKQIGTAGLFLDWQVNYYLFWQLGEIYYRLGMFSEAEHCAFEALVSSPKEPNAQTLRRLTLINIARRDSATAGKYIRYFEHSLAYRGWAHQQRVNLASAMADSSFHIPGTPKPYRYRDFFISYQQPDYSLLTLLESNPTHRLAFEYLMAFYLLQKDLKQMKWCMDHFFTNFEYPNIPTHYEEALLAYKDLMRENEQFYEQYPVSRTTRERFAGYVQAYKTAQSSKRNFEQLQKQFGNSYWYYLHFVVSSPIMKKDEQNRY